MDKESNQGQCKSYVYNDKILRTERAIVESFASHFSSMYSSAEADYSDYSQLSVSDVRVWSIHEGDIISAINCEFANSRLKPKKAVGPDYIPQYVVKACGETFTTPLHNILNLTISTPEL